MSASRAAGTRTASPVTRFPSGRGSSVVCDAYHAMVSNRAYRPARDSDAAIAELRRCSGSQFDPAVVEAFCAALAESDKPAPVLVGALPS